MSHDIGLPVLGRPGWRSSAQILTDFKMIEFFITCMFSMGLKAYNSSFPAVDNFFTSDRHKGVTGDTDTHTDGEVGK